MKVFQRLAHAFKAEGCTATFGMMGDANMMWLHEMHKLGIKVHEVRHEGAGLGMADGWARATQTPGVATATCGPGTTQLATAFVTAARAQSPLVAFCGEFPTNDGEYNQRLDQSAFATGCEAAFVRMATADAADEAVREAFYRARTESRPVLLSVPMDLQQKEWEDDDPYVPSTALIPATRPFPDPAVIKQAADLIASARLPVIIAGQGAQWADAGAAILRLGERIGALIATSLRAKTWLNDECDYHAGISGLYGSRTAMQLMHEADLVVGVGASLNRYTMENGYLYPDARIIQIDTRQQVLMSGGKLANVYIQADGRVGVDELDKALAARKFSNTGYRTPEVRQKLVDHWKDPAVFDIEPGTVDPRAAMMLLDEKVPGNVSLFCASGSVASMANMMMHRRRPLNQAGHFFGCIGQMMPAAMGAIAATGNSPAMLIDGDASFMMHLAEFETAVRYEMPLLAVVMNNQALGAEYYKLDVKKMNVKTAEVSTPNLGAIAIAMGGKGALVRTMDEMLAAVKEWVANPGPMVIDVRVSRTVMSIPYRRLHYGKDE